MNKKRISVHVLEGKKGLIESFFSLAILNAINTILPLITLPYLVNIVGLERYGSYSFCYAIIQYVLLISAYGFNLSATKQIAQNRNNIQLLSKIFNSVVVCKILISILLFLLLFLLFLCDDNLFTFIWLIPYGIGMVIGDTLMPIWLFQGLEKMRYITIINFISKFTFTGLIFILIKSSNDYKLILLLNSLGYFLSGIISLYIANRVLKIKLFFPSIHDVSFQYRDGFQIFLSTIGMNVYRNSNILLLGFFSSEVVVGLYSTAEKIIKGIQGLVTPVTEALYPYLSNKFAKANTTDSIALVLKISRMMVFIYFLILLLMYIFVSPLVSFLFGSEIESKIIVLLYIMTPVVLFGGMGYIFGVLGLYSMGLPRLFLRSVICSGVINICVLFIFISLNPLYAAGIATLASEITLSLLCLFYLSRLKKTY